jgi:ABC-type uncharacterized transport system permease subunit
MTYREFVRNITASSKEDRAGSIAVAVTIITVILTYGAILALAFGSAEPLIIIMLVQGIMAIMGAIGFITYTFTYWFLSKRSD